MTEFIDPRSDPRPPASVSREPAAHGEELRDLVRLCLKGSVYDVERWIREGRPIQALTYKRPRKTPVLSPLRTAIRRKHRDLVLLLLSNGYRLDLEVTDGGSVLDEALNVRAFDILDLLLEWGAEPTKVNPFCVLETYSSALIDQFWRAGVDYTQDRYFASFLATNVNKPLYGWLRRNRSDQRLQDALDIALLEAVHEDREKAVHLLVWAGADPHRKVPMASDLGRSWAWEPDTVYSAAEAAVSFGRPRLLEVLRVESMPDLESRAQHAHDASMLRRIVALKPPPDWSPVILKFLRDLCWRHARSSWDTRDAIRFAEKNGGRLTHVPAHEMRFLRRELLELRREDDLRWLLRWLSREKHCEPAIFEQLTRTPAMRAKLAALDAKVPYQSPSQSLVSLIEPRKDRHGRRQAAKRTRRTAQDEHREPAPPLPKPTV